MRGVKKLTYNGVINVFKPPGVTSHDVVAKIRKILKTKKVGHTGTLDPDAVGVLPICIGKATRLAEYLTADKKIYRTILTFGYETDTQDSSGQIISQKPLPEASIEQFGKNLEAFLGEIEQLPPMYSAVKVNGQPLYKLARQGQEIERKSRKVYIHKIDLLEYDGNKALLEIACGKGTYIRTLCQDIARSLNSAGHMSFLIRVKSGVFQINHGFTLEEIASLPLDQVLITPRDALNFPEIVLKPNLERLVLNGNKISLDLIEQSLEPKTKYKVLNITGELLSIANVINGYLQPEKVIGEAKC